jgi:DNA-binding response OmpR family regulator
MVAVRPTVLYVDDDADVCLSAAWLRRRAGFAVRAAGTGAEALRLARDGPDLSGLDVVLPDLSGLEVCRRLRADPATCAIPVRFLSGLDIDPGGAAYLPKPTEPEVLVARLEALRRPGLPSVASRAPSRAGRLPPGAVVS